MELGPLERELMELVWQSDEASVRDVHEQVQRRLAYTTVMTTLDRLFRKGILVRIRRGRAFVYSAKISRQQIAQNAFQKVLDHVADSFRNETRPVMACLLDAVSEQDLVSLDELEEMIRQRRLAKAKDGK